MSNRRRYASASEPIAYAVFAVGAVATVFWLYYFSPVGFTLLITEDMWAEYATAISFSIAGALMLGLSWRSASGFRRVVWVVIGLVALLIAAEEVSWGQRILGVETPDFLRDQNLQGEITLHNLENVRIFPARETVGYLMVLWAAFSVIISMRATRIEGRLRSLGVPLIPGKLVVVFLLAPFFFLVYPIAKSDEVGEMFLGVAAMMWALDLFMSHARLKRPMWLGPTATMAGMMCLVVALSAAFSHSRFFTWGPAWRLNNMAAQIYPDRGLYEHAERLFDYMYAHPEFMTNRTRINHVAVLLEAGNEPEAHSVLVSAAADLAAADLPEERFLVDLRTLCELLGRLEYSDQTVAAFERALDPNPPRLALIAEADDPPDLGQSPTCSRVR